MIKDIFKLRKHSWHANLMNFIWGWNPEDFTHMCPYFWLTLFNIVGFPVIMMVKGIFYVTEKIQLWEEARIDSWAEEYYYRLKNNPEERRKFYGIDIHKDSNRKYFNFYNRLFSRDEDFFHLLSRDRIAYRSSLSESENSTKPFALTHKDQINKTLRILKPFIQGFIVFLGTALTILVVYMAYRGIVYFLSLPLKTITDIILIAIGYFLGFIVGYKLLGAISRHRESKIVIILSYPFRKAGQGIANTYQFIRSMIKESCPAIEWVDNK